MTAFFADSEYGTRNMHVVVEIVGGRNAGQKMEIGPQQKGLVGRAGWAEIALHNDKSMAGEHFVVECGTTACAIRALSREHPVFVNGTKIGQANLYDGDEIKAGTNTFRAQVRTKDGMPVKAPAGTEAPAPAAAVAPPPQPQQEPASGAYTLRDVLRHAQPLYALLDAARDERVLELLRESGEQYECLYEGYKAEEMAEVAPYLVQLPSRSKLLETLAREGWGNAWGVYLTSHAPFKEVRKHFRHFLTVESQGEEYLFRFYDPRVLRTFLPVCNAAETAEFFGMVEQFLLEMKDPGRIAIYRALPANAKEEVLLKKPTTTEV